MIDEGEPFSGTAAVGAGLVTRHRLRHHFVRLHRDVYIAREIQPTPLLRAKAARLWAGSSGVLVGMSAAAVHGTRWLDATAPAELVRTGHVRSVPGIVVRKASCIETCTVDGMIVTTPAQMAFDLARRDDGLQRRVEIFDALCNATHLLVHDGADFVARRHGL